MRTIKSALAMGVALICKMAAGLVAVKITAHYLGVANFGLTGQISSLIAIVTLLSSGGVSVGLTKIFADTRFDPDSEKGWLRAAWLLAGLFALMLFIGFLIFRSTIEKNVLGDSGYAGVIFVALCLTIIPISSSGISQGIINGSHRDRTYSRSLVLGSALGLFGFLVLSWWFSAIGALLGMIWIAVAQALAFIWSARGLRDKCPQRNIAAVELKTKMRFLFNFGMLSITAGVTIPLVYMAVRVLIESHHGAAALGIWQATVRLSEAYTQLPIVMLSVVFFSRFASAAGKPLILKSVFETYAFVAGLMLIISVFVFFARHLLVRILFTDQFSSVSDYVGWQLLGDSFRMLAYTGTIILGARGKIRWGIAGEFAQAILFIGLSVILIPMYETVAPFLAYTLAYFIYFILTLLALRYASE